jgi:hypothetical protein
MTAFTNRDGNAPGYRNSLEPSSCSYCGVRERDHFEQWSARIGWHAWIAPTDEQIMARMLCRRRDPLRWSFSR